MRRRILGVAVLSVVVAVLLFGLPLAFAVGRLFYDEERSELERVALRGAEAMPADVRASGALRLPTVDSAVHVAVYGLDGTRLSGDGPPVADLAVRGACTAGSPTSGPARCSSSPCRRRPPTGSSVSCGPRPPRARSAAGSGGPGPG